MSRILRTLLILLIIVALATWFFTVFKSCGNKNQTLTNAADKIEESATDLADSTSAAISDAAERLEDQFSDDPEAEGDDSETTADDANGTLTDENDPSSNTSSTTEDASDDFAGNGDWNYLVVTGSFMRQANAKLEANNIRKKGFKDAEVVIFDLSQYYSVIAGRYNSLRQARRIKNQLTTMGMEAYVHKKRSKRRS